MLTNVLDLSKIPVAENLSTFDIKSPKSAYVMNSLVCCSRSLTKSTTPPGTASSEGTSAAMSPMRPSTSSISTLAKWPFCCSSQAETKFILINWPFVIDWLQKGWAFLFGTCLLLAASFFVPFFKVIGRKMSMELVFILFSTHRLNTCYLLFFH